MTDDNCYNIVDMKTSVEAMFSEKLLEDSFIFLKNLFDMKHSSVFELRYNGFSYKEISELLDIPVSTVDGRMYRVRQILHERYKFEA